MYTKTLQHYVFVNIIYARFVYSEGIIFYFSPTNRRAENNTASNYTVITHKLLLLLEHLEELLILHEFYFTVLINDHPETRVYFHVVSRGIELKNVVTFS